MNYFFLTIIISLGLITSYEDFKFGKIRNQWILLGLFLGIFFWSCFLIFTRLVNINYFLLIIVNFLIAVLVGFTMWRIKAWSAGDAKMFMVYTLLVPFSFYAKTYLKFFPAFIILFNTFLLVLVSLLMLSGLYLIKSFCRKLLKNEKINFDYINNFLKTKQYFQGLLRFLPSFLLFMIVVNFFYNYVNQIAPINYFLFEILAFIPVIIFSKPLTRLYQMKFTNLISFGIFLIILFLGFKFNFLNSKLFSINIFWAIVIFMILFPFFHKVINFYLEQANGHEVEVNNLIPGMILKKATIEKLDLQNNYSFAFTGLTAEQIQVVKNHAEEKNIQRIVIGRPFYFAIWLFIGVLTTLFFRGSLLKAVLGW